MSSAASSPYHIGRSPGRCAETGRAFEPGEPYIAAVVEREGEEGFERVEYSEDAWARGARPERLFGYWRAVMHSPDAAPKPFVDDGSLLELFDSLEDGEDDRAALRFVVTLMLLRKRMLRHVGQRHRQDRREMLVRRAGETAESPAIAVLDPGLAASEVESIAGQLAPILSGAEGGAGHGAGHGAGRETGSETGSGAGWGGA